MYVIFKSRIYIPKRKHKYFNVIKYCYIDLNLHPKKILNMDDNIIRDEAHLIRRKNSNNYQRVRGLLHQSQKFYNNFGEFSEF